MNGVSEDTGPLWIYAQILDRAQGLTAPPDLARLLESGPALRTVWTVAVWTPDPGETHQAKLGEAGTGFSHPKIQNPESGIRDSTW